MTKKKITDYELKNIIWYMNFYLLESLKNKEQGKLLIEELINRLLKKKKEQEKIKLIAEKYEIGESFLYKFNKKLDGLLYERFFIN